MKVQLLNKRHKLHKKSGEFTHYELQVLSTCTSYGEEEVGVLKIIVSEEFFHSVKNGDSIEIDFIPTKSDFPIRVNHHEKI